MTVWARAWEGGDRRHERASQIGLSGQAAGMAALPAKALHRDIRAFRLRADLGSIACAMRLAKGVAACGERDRLLVIHAHPLECLADIAG